MGLLVGVVVTAVLLAGGGWATQEAMAQAATPAPGGAPLWIALGSMAGVGLVLGLVVAGRISPLAAFVPSMVLLAWTVVYALDANRALSLVPGDPTLHEVILQAAKGATALLTTGVLGLVGVALFVPVLMPSRWSGREEADEEDYEESTEAGYY
ncbi:hypothetical protein [Microtetraspora sp. NBRC 13810]|uniref:hypothetical protein n=1 Tax=Microtetraspora sp. NBRC 13810 TaxID=3030990 RepID=UPI002555285B|nr:hypothetical protein [Microtetraspora sp. NBRC 13810]